MGRFFRRKKDAEQTEDGETVAVDRQESVGGDGARPAPTADADAPASVEQATERTRKGFFGRIGGLFKRGGLDESLWEELEETLVLADAGVKTTMRIISDVRERVKAEKIAEPEVALQALKDEMVKVLDVETGRGKIWHSTGQHETLPKLAVILVVGVNGTGKTTSIGKLAHTYADRGLKVVLAAGDTFRAAAIEQLKHWGAGAGVDVVAHQQGSDPGAVEFDAMAAAEKRDADILIIDTAGRLHTKAHLMEELQKVNRIIQRKLPDAPHEVLLVLDATTGQNAMQQAKYFTEAVGVTAVLLSKLDGTAKGGVVFSVCDELKVPVRFVGTGERPQDLALFQPRAFVEALFGG
ncbi:MAG: signal recognition particle-docking protein FtsY [Chloroflexota bacterium]|nr:signal recognition particle-docking protein FtsY [Chloroflexota bacterium]